MNLENGFSIILIVNSVIMFLIGWNYLKKTPKYSKVYKGFTKSKHEGRSEAHWVFSHKLGGRLYIYLSGILLGLGVIGLFMDMNLMIGLVLGITILGVGVTVIRIKVDNALIDKFGK